ncbi:hypothetical protein EW146_g2256 [Bondarzewia mesenterica]|uniref:Glucose-methanol-choline oxidoreductase N-terminal domain-containing protein n=1 Tax=Bondarzewia mesenterica TaxID=1095465 RepID=A0A4S4M7F7_9AGAM|nr:hypothetical protein EW146_g2256 [Bondarzewia mesenterica]
MSALPSEKNESTDLQGFYSWSDTLKGVYYGPGSLSTALPKLRASIGGTKALIITGRSLYTKVRTHALTLFLCVRGFIRAIARPVQTDVVKRVEAVLRSENAYGATFHEIGEHAPIAGIRAGIKTFRDAEADFIVSVGGGSPIDAAKAIIYNLQKESGGQFVKQIAIPTTLSAAEYTIGAGFTNEQGVKASVSSPELGPAGIILDAELTLPTPEQLWLSTGIRALDHAVETLYRPFVTPPIKALCYQAIHDLFEYLPKSKANPQDVAIRQKLQLASWMSLWPMKLEKYSALGLSHALGHKLGATYSIPHGVTSCLTLAPTIRLKARVASDEDKEWLSGALFYLRQPTTGSPESDVQKLADLIDELVANLGLKTDLAHYKVPHEDAPKIAELALGGQTEIYALLPPLALALFVGSASGKLYTNPSQLSKHRSYDYIVVGGGAGGGVVANRLTENSDIRVLLIEAGSSDYKNVNIEVPWFAPALAGTQFDWNFTTVAQPGLNGRSIPYPRGYVLGGSTAINYMTHCRGSKDDYDRWAEVTGDDGWSWDSLHPYMLKMEKLTPPADHHNTVGEIDPRLHGTSGPVGFSLPGHLLPTDDRVLNASAELSDDFPFNLDFNSGNTIGISWIQNTIEDGERVDAATAYIAPALSRSNLDVLVNTHVTRVIQTGTQSGIPIFRGVQLAQSSSSAKYILNASKEVIISAGAVKTPHILMLSGIGDSSQLSLFGIDTIVDLPDVGQNLQDHPLLTSSYTVKSNDTLDNLIQDARFTANRLELWKANHTGELVLAPANQLGWFRLPGNAAIFDKVADPSAGPRSAHYEFIFTDGFVSFKEAAPSGGHFFTVFTNVISPSARGNITLRSSDPFDAPSINPNLLGTEFDIYTMREAVKAARTYMSAKAWDGWILEEFGAFAEAQSDAEIEQYARNFGHTVSHVTGTVAMGKSGSAGRGSGALNSDLTVKGTVGLRVVDASAFPFIPSAHTQSPTYILAERAADLVKSAIIEKEFSIMTPLNRFRSILSRSQHQMWFAINSYCNVLTATTMSVGTTCVNSMHSLSIKGGTDEDAVLCTSDKTYSVRSVVLSNSVLVATPAKDAPESDSIEVQHSLNEILELVPAVPKLHRLRGLLRGMEWEDGREDDDGDDEMEDEEYGRPRKRVRFSYEQARADLQASEQELSDAIKEKRILIMNGHLRPMSPSYLHTILELLLMYLASLSQPHDAASVTDLSLSLEDEHEIKREVVMQVMGWFGDLSGAKWKMDVEAVDDPVPEHEFLTKWRTAVGDTFAAQVSLPLLSGNYLSSTSPFTSDLLLSYFPRAELPSDPSARFLDLFLTRTRWQADDIAPFLSDIAVNTKERDKLLLKYARALTDKDGVWYTARAR